MTETGKRTQEEARGKEAKRERSGLCSPSLSQYADVRQPYDRHASDDYSRPTGHERSPGVVDTTSPVLHAVGEYKRNCNIHSPQNDRGNANEELEENLTKDRIDSSDSRSNKEPTRPDKARSMPPLANAYCNPQIARNLAVENLRHHPLPDTVEDALYRSLQLKKDKHPGKVLDVEPRAAAVGCKGYGVPGPTQCSKLKVYRPKTAGVIPNSKEQIKEIARPKTSNSDYRNKHLSQMQLALCWDLKPSNPGDEPKRSSHIDGSNGSAAPAVFALVQPPSEERLEFTPPPCASPTGKSAPLARAHHKHSHGSGSHGSRPTSTKSASSAGRNGSGSSLLKRQPRSAWEGIEQKQRGANPSAVMDIIDNADVQLEPLVSSRYTQQRQHKLKENVPPENARDTSASLTNSSKLSKTKQHCQSTPNLTNAGNSDQQQNNKANRNRLLNNRPCMACEMKVNTSNNKNGQQHKIANDSNNNNESNITYSNGSTISTIKSNKINGNNNVQVPKPRTPYAKRSYSIGTLAPPFSLWPGTMGQAYPEHWRLASVYQHSYKPIQSRRKTFLQSVYQ